MEHYFGTRELLARPMVRGDYNNYRGWETLESENHNEEGYLVEYLDGGKANDLRHSGYISWSPKDVFEASYQRTDSMNFGHALVALKQGKRVARAGWYGRGMSLIMQEVSTAPYRVRMEIAEEADGIIAVGWIASQPDMLAEDWQIVE